MALKTVLASAAGVGVLMTALAAMAQQPTPAEIRALMAQSREGAPTYQAVCDSCHGPPNPRTPSRTDLAAMTAERVYEALTVGKMKVAGDTITDSQKRAVSIYLTGKPLNVAPVEIVPVAPAVPGEAPKAPAPAEAPSGSAPADAHDH